MNNRAFITYALGIFVSYFYFGILQEKVTRGKYTFPAVDEDGKPIQVVEKYTCTLTLVITQCLINYLMATVVLHMKSHAEDKTPKVYYASVSLTYLLGMICSNMALQWVSFPTQVVGKSAKPIPVMILGVLIGKKSCALKKYFFVLLIVIGVVLFMLKDKASPVVQDNSVGVGELLICLSLTMDGLTGAVQERMRSETKPTGLQMMKTSNAWSVMYLAIPIVLTGEIFNFIEFAGRHPAVLYNLILMGLTSAIGNLFLYSMVSEFGPLAVSIVTTTRKFFTVLASVIFFGNPLTTRQWAGAALVFTSLFLDAYYGKKPQKPK